MKDKYCPIVAIAKQAHSNCVEEECAWWDDVMEKCAVLSIVYALHWHPECLECEEEDDGPVLSS